MEAVTVDLEVAGFGDLADLHVLQFLPQDPARALAERSSERAGRALDHGDLPPRRMGYWLAADAPALEKFLAGLPAAARVHREEQGHVVADAAAANDDDALARLHRAVEYFGVADDPRIVAAGHIEQARGDAGRDDDL